MAMEWYELFDKEHTPPNLNDMGDYIASPLWEDMLAFIDEAYASKPKIAYSSCSQKGWNVKYKKSGKALCTLYPMRGHFIALVTLTPEQAHEVELALPTYGAYLQKLFKETKTAHGEKWLMIEVNSPDILEEAKRLIRFKTAK